MIDYSQYTIGRVVRPREELIEHLFNTKVRPAPLGHVTGFTYSLSEGGREIILLVRWYNSDTVKPIHPNNVEIV